MTTIWNTPSISADNKFIANLSVEYGMEGVPNGIQVWKLNQIKDGSLDSIPISKYFELDQLEWVPMDFVWESGKSLILKVVSVDAFMDSREELKDEDYYYLKSTLKII